MQARSPCPIHADQPQAALAWPTFLAAQELPCGLRLSLELPLCLSDGAQEDRTGLAVQFRAIQSEAFWPAMKKLVAAECA